MASCVDRRGLFGLQQGAEDLSPDLIACIVEVEVIGVQQFFAGLAGGIESGLPEIHKVSAGVLFAERANQLIGAQDFLAVLPAFDAGFDGEEEDFAAHRKGVVDFGQKGLKVLQDGFGCFAVIQIVVTGVEDDDFWFGGLHKAFKEMHGVRKIRAAKSVIDCIELWKSGLQIPASDGGAADKDDAGCGFGALCKPGLQSRDVFVPFFRRIVIGRDS